jgi:DNA primase
MAIDFDNFIQWAEEKFQDVIVKGNEVRINSIFTEDQKHHLWCNPYGGKHHRDDGCYRCFKTDKKGTLIGLVMEVDNCSYTEAKEILSGNTPIGVLEDRLNDFFNNKDKVEEILPNSIRLPEDTYLIDELPKTSLLKMEAEWYLTKRKLPTKGLYICLSGDYKNRIIIPYYNENGKLIYFNGRKLDNKGLRYLGPEEKIYHVGKGDVLYTPEWPNPGDKIYLTEGEFDALTLFICGFHGMACGGKYLTDKQVEMLRKYDVCLALDEDEAGFSGVIGMGKQLMEAQTPSISFVRPPKNLKDWNKMLVNFKPEIIKGWIERNETTFDNFTIESLLLSH